MYRDFFPKFEVLKGEPDNAFELRGGEGSEVHSPTDGASGVALQLVAALVRDCIRIRT